MVIRGRWVGRFWSVVVVLLGVTWHGWALRGRVEGGRGKEWRCGWRLTLVNVTRRPLFRRENEGVMLVRCAAAECRLAGWRAGGR